MSMILCTRCGELCDCDEYPEGFYRLDQNGGEGEQAERESLHHVEAGKFEVQFHG